MNYFKFTSLFISIVVACSSCFAQIKVMSYNIRYDAPNDGDNCWKYRKNDIVQLISYYYPDFIGIQEAMPNQLKFITSQLHHYNYIGHGRDGIGTASEGIPLFYNRDRYTLLDKDLFWLSTTPEKASKGWDAEYNRIVVYGQFISKTTNQIIHVFNTHFDHKGTEARSQSAQLLINYIKNNQLTGKNIVLMGDFNSLPSDAPIKQLEQEFTNSYNLKDSSVYGPIGTFNGFNTIQAVTTQIDYIFTKNIEVKNYRCIDDRRANNLYLSDHFPIIIQI